MNEWISVKDRLPEKPGRYLVYEEKDKHLTPTTKVGGLRRVIVHNLLAFNYTYPCCKPNIAYYRQYCDGWQWSSLSDNLCTPTHWMSLPEPPK